MGYGNRYDEFDSGRRYSNYNDYDYDRRNRYRDIYYDNCDSRYRYHHDDTIVDVHIEVPNDHRYY